MCAAASMETSSEPTPCAPHGQIQVETLNESAANVDPVSATCDVGIATGVDDVSMPDQSSSSFDNQDALASLLSGAHATAGGSRLSGKRKKAGSTMLKRYAVRIIKDFAIEHKDTFCGAIPAPPQNASQQLVKHFRGFFPDSLPRQRFMDENFCVALFDNGVGQGFKKSLPTLRARDGKFYGITTYTAVRDVCGLIAQFEAVTYSDSARSTQIRSITSRPGNLVSMVSIP